MTWTVFVFSVLLIGVSSASVVRRDVHQNGENPTVTEEENPGTDEEPGTDDPERSEFQGWNRQQVLNYMSGENGYSSSSYTTEETLKRQRIAEIREQILQTLGISDPTAHSTPKLTEHQESELISTFNRSRAISDRTRTFECVVAACEMPMNQSLHVRQVNAKSMQLYFDTYFSDDEKRITNSTLKLCLKELTERQRQRLLRTYDPRLEVRVYMYLPTRRANGRPRRTVVDITMVSPDVENWVLLDIKPAVRRWKRDPSANYGLEVVVKNTQEQRLNANQLFVGVNCTLNETNVCVPSHNLEEALGVPRDLPDYDNNMAPNLHLVKEEEQYSTSEINVDRIRRDVHANAPCVKYPLTVSLSDLGWNNMAFRPNTINVGMCVGNCTSNDDDSPECTRCFPTRYKSMFLAYRDSRGNTGSGNVEDVIVDECGVLESA